jgi:hypothetical protein
MFLLVLLSLVLLQGDRAGLSKLLDASMAAGKQNVAFLCLFLLGQVRPAGDHSGCHALRSCRDGVCSCTRLAAPRNAGPAGHAWLL